MYMATYLCISNKQPASFLVPIPSLVPGKREGPPASQIVSSTKERRVLVSFFLPGVARFRARSCRGWLDGWLISWYEPRGAVDGLLVKTPSMVEFFFGGGEGSNRAIHTLLVKRLSELASHHITAQQTR